LKEKEINIEKAKNDKYDKKTPPRYQEEKDINNNSQPR